MTARARGRIRRGLVIALGGVLLLAGCLERPTAPHGVALERVEFTDLAGWAEDDPSGALQAFARSCAAILARDPARSMGGAGFAGTAGDWQPGCAEARAMVEAPGVDGAAARRFFERAFAPFRVLENGTPEGLFTGYYEPELRGALRPGGAYEVPLYARPPDLVEVDLGAFRGDLKGERIAGRVEGERFVPYADRAAIASGALSGDGLELVWVDDAVAAFFLHIQGSGRIVFEDGPARRIGYAASNGHVYYAIGRALVERGALGKDEVSLQTIRAWFGAHPDEAAAVMALNPSYVFFRWLPGDGSEPGPPGGGERAANAGPLARGGPPDPALGGAGLDCDQRAAAGRRRSAVAPPGNRPGHRWSDPGRGARRPVLGCGRRRRTGRGPYAPDRKHRPAAAPCAGRGGG